MNERTVRRAHRAAGRTGAAPVPPAQSLYEMAELLREEFDESGQHVSLIREHTGAELGPVRDLSLQEISPGALGWRRELRWRGRAATDRNPSAPPDATLYYVVLPDPGKSGEDKSPPLRGLRWEDFTYAAERARPPRAVLLLRTSSPATESRSRRFAEAVGHEFEVEIRGE